MTKSKRLLDFVCFVMFLLVLTGVGLLGAQHVQGADRVVAVNAAADQYAERVLELPNDGQKWDLIIFTSAAWETNRVEREFVSWFTTNARLAAFRKQVRFHHRTTGDFAFKHKWAKVYGTDPKLFPGLILQSAAGHKVYKASGENLPKTSAALANAISARLSTAYAAGELVGDAQELYGARLEGRRLRPLCPQPNPNTEPLVPQVPTTVVTNVVPTIPDDVEEKDEHGSPVGLIVAVGLVTLAVAFVVQIKNAAG